MRTPDDPKRIEASPTKDFFISMLTKDIGLLEAMVDLVDNCVDGARRTRPSGAWDDLEVRIRISSDEFRIVDNCGGIDASLARDYAFCFGRPENMPSVPHSIGRFGVGMKRALFKLGKCFRVESATTSSRFAMKVDVEDWEQSEDWAFRFDQLSEDEGAPEEKTGTTITVRSLHDSVATEFGLEDFVARLAAEVEARHQDTMAAGLSISINGIPLQYQPARLLQSDELAPAYYEETFDHVHAAPLAVRVFAGVAGSDPSAAGWYLFCNGRLILEADQTLTTGWGENRESTIPKYHNQFARFRGYAYFESDDPRLLPWNTTKTGVDPEAEVFRAVRQKMVTITRPVIDFLNELDKEKDTEETVLESGVKRARLVELSRLGREQKVFSWTPAPSKPGPRIRRIQYDKPEPEIERAQEVLEVDTLKEVGERTFDYFYSLECQD